MELGMPIVQDSVLIKSLSEMVQARNEQLAAKDAEIARLPTREDELNALCLDYQIDIDAARQEITALKQERDDYRVAARLAEVKETAVHHALNEMRGERDALKVRLSWTEYDGSVFSLPPEGASVIICVGGIVQKAHVCRFEDSSWDFGEDIDLLPIKVGDLWMPWPLPRGVE